MDNTTKSSSFGGSGHKLYLATIRKCNTVYSIQCMQCAVHCAVQYIYCRAVCPVQPAEQCAQCAGQGSFCRAMCAQCAVCAEECAQCAEQYVQSNVCRAMCRGVHLLQISMCSAVCANAMQSPTLLTVG